MDATEEEIKRGCPAVCSLPVLFNARICNYLSWLFGFLGCPTTTAEDLGLFLQLKDAELVIQFLLLVREGFRDKEVSLLCAVYLRLVFVDIVEFKANI